jgi:replication-associated recombination protein RarA
MQQRLISEAPLAARMRPRTLDEYVGQEYIIGAGKLLRRAIEADRLFSSIILWGPPGTGKTTLAQVIANRTQSHFETLSAVLAGKAELKEVIDAAQERRRLYQKKTTLFVDEVHRWNKAQQDALLPHVENGTILLIGATTENPYFEVIGALVSRSRVFQLLPLTGEQTGIILDRALADPERGYGSRRVLLDPDAALYWLAKMLYAGEDPRFILRRLIILAGEDIGLADPMGIVVAASAMQAFTFIGLPEGVYPIVEATLYLATAPKSNTATSYFKAFERIEQEGVGDVPNHLKDNTRDAIALGHGKGYVYPHMSEDHFTPQQYLPKELLGTYFYKPSSVGYEVEVSDRLSRWRAAQRKALGITRSEEIPDLTQEQIDEMKRKIK